MKWIGPLFTNAGGWEAYVSYHDGKWFIDKDSPIVIEGTESGVKLLPMLQEEYGKGYENQLKILKKGLLKNGQNMEAIESFPFHAPVITAFENMPGWVSYASDWVKHLKLNMEIAQFLFEKCQNKNLEQSARHKTLKVVNNWAKNNDFVFLK